MVHPGAVSEPTRGPRPAQPPRTAAAPAAPAAPARTAGKPASRPPPPGPPRTAVTPRQPPVVPVAPTRSARIESLPPEDAWTDATTTTDTRALRLTEEMRGEVRAIARVAVDEALAPLVKEIRELTAAVERERRERAEGDARTLQSAAAVAKKTTLPGVSDAPPVAVIANSLPPQWVAVSVPAPSYVAELATTPTVPRVAPAPSPVAVVARAPDLSIDSGPLYEELQGMLDGARRRKRNGVLVALFLLLLVGGLFAAMVISQTQPR